MKRTAEHQITKDNFEVENGDSGNANSGEGFEKAAPEVLRARRIVKVRRTVVPKKTVGAAEENKPNPFAAISAAPPSVADGTGTTVKKPNSSTPIPAAAPKVPDAAAADNATTKATVTPAEPASAGNKPPAVPAPVNGESVPEKEKEVEAPGDKEVPKVSNAVESTENVTAVEAESTDDAAKEASATAPVEKEAAAGEASKASDAAPVVNNASKEEAPADGGKAEEAPAKANDSSAEAKSPGAASPEAGGKVEMDDKAASAPANDDTKPRENAVAGAKATDSPAEASAKKDDKAAAGGKPAEARPFTFGGSAPFVFGGSSGSGKTPFASFADAAAADKTKAPFSFSVPTFSAAEKSAPVAAAFGAEPVATATQKYEETAVETGEEDETEVFRSKSKVFALEDKAWKERGVGTFKMNIDTKSGRARLLMRTEATLRLALNTPLFAQFKMVRSGERGVTFRCVSSQKSFLVRFPSKAEVAQLEQAVEDWKKTV